MADESEALAAISLLFLVFVYRVLKRRKRCIQKSKSRARSVWVRPIFRQRHRQGDFHNLCTYQFKAGGGGGRAWGGDLTFFKNLPSNSLPTGQPFQSNAQKFPHPGRRIARTLIVRIGKKIDFVSLYPRLLQYRNI